MEEEQSGPEKQDQPDEQQQEGPTQQAGGNTAIRSYECNFCKRGFTNAQALGGHMNIHRKDKAKLKQSSTPTPQPQHFPPSPFFPPPNIFHHPMDDQKGGKWFSSLKEPIATSRDHKSKSTHEGKQQQLPLIGADNQAASGIENQNPLPLPPAEAPELDLELRLGHNIDLPSSDHSSKGTRRFF